MAYTQHHHVCPGIAASPIGQYLLVKQVAVDDSFVVAGSTTERPFGLTIATSPSAGAECAVVWEGVAKGIAGTAVTAGDIVGHATAGKLGPVGAAVGTGTIRFAVGVAMQSAAAGGTFSVALERGQIF